MLLHGPNEQTRRWFYHRFNEHMYKKDLNQKKYNFSQHSILLQISNHNYTNFATNLPSLHICKTDRYMDAARKFEIHKMHKSYLEDLLNDPFNFKSEVMYDRLCTMWTSENLVAGKTIYVMSRDSSSKISTYGAHRYYGALMFLGVMFFLSSSFVISKCRELL